MSSTDKLVIPAYNQGSEREFNEWFRNLRTAAKQHKYVLDIIEAGIIRPGSEREAEAVASAARAAAAAAAEAAMLGACNAAMEATALDLVSPLPPASAPIAPPALAPPLPATLAQMLAQARAVRVCAATLWLPRAQVVQRGEQRCAQRDWFVPAATWREAGAGHVAVAQHAAPDLVWEIARRAQSRHTLVPVWIVAPRGGGPLVSATHVDEGGACHADGGTASKAFLYVAHSRAASVAAVLAVETRSGEVWSRCHQLYLTSLASACLACLKGHADTIAGTTTAADAADSAGDGVGAGDVGVDHTQMAEVASEVAAAAEEALVAEGAAAAAAGGFDDGEFTSGYHVAAALDELNFGCDLGAGDVPHKQAIDDERRRLSTVPSCDGA